MLISVDFLAFFPCFTLICIILCFFQNLFCAISEPFICRCLLRSFNMLHESARLKKRRNRRIKYASILFFSKNAKLNTPEIRLPNFRGIKYWRK